MTRGRFDVRTAPFTGRPTVPKVLGGDVELANFIVGPEDLGQTSDQASRLLLAAIDGIDAGMGMSVQDVDTGRKYLASNGGCAYLDSQHLEVCIPEVRSAFDYLAYGRAMFEVARAAAGRVNAALPDGYQVHLAANCSDGLGNSYGSHVNVLLTREAWTDIFHRRTGALEYLASFQIASLAITGQGKAGAEHDRPPADYQLSQRADFIETIASFDTMVHRGVINSRDESHCTGLAGDSGPALARLHVIFFDSTLSQVATVLRAGMLQMVTAMIEARSISTDRILDRPLEALATFSRSPDLAATAALAGGQSITAVELLREFHGDAVRFASAGGFDGIVPDHDRLLALWDDTLTLLERRDFRALGRRLDWVLKRQLLEGVMDRDSGAGWQSPVIKHLDQMFASLDEEEGLFWPLEASGHVETVLEAGAVAHALETPPPDTRAWTRARLLRLAGSDQVDQIDWNRVRVRLPSHRGTRTTLRTIFLPVPYADTRADHAGVFDAGAELPIVAELLGASDEWPPAAASVIRTSRWFPRQGEQP